MPTIYGIRNCDTMKKAFAWLEGHDVRYAFHDYKSAGIEESKLQEWAGKVEWTVLLNTRGTTWRKLSPAQQADMDEGKAIRLMVENPSLIKRPVLEEGHTILVGFDESAYAARLGKRGA